MLSLKKKNKTKQSKINTKNNNKTNQQKRQEHIIAPVYITGGDAIKPLLSMINR